MTAAPSSKLSRGSRRLLPLILAFPVLCFTSASEAASDLATVRMRIRVRPSARLTMAPSLSAPNAASHTLAVREEELASVAARAQTSPTGDVILTVATVYDAGGKQDTADPERLTWAAPGTLTEAEAPSSTRAHTVASWNGSGERHGTLACSRNGEPHPANESTVSGGDETTVLYTLIVP